ncbi:MAG TPA: alpha-glucan family phosphorylase [Phycisphaerae bacterium]|nr:alpha-glucan family phosphorylase [Phycisphaerae bacterium]
MDIKRTVAYFSMEIGLEPGIPTYSGGLGILAGDTIRAAASLKVPMVAVTLVHRKGYFYQGLGPDGWQTESPVNWVVDDSLIECDAEASVTIEGRQVHLRAWRYDVAGAHGFTVPVYLLDCDLPANAEADRTFTHFLYGGDNRYRLCQEIILGIGGVRMLRALGHDQIERYHMNEGHAALLAFELLDEWGKQQGRPSIDVEAVEAVRRCCVFTTHTPVPAGHDQFPLEMVDRVLGHRAVSEIQEFCCFLEKLNMTYLALNLSHYVNGVAKRHGEVSRQMLGNYAIDSITNGVDAANWASEPFQDLFDRYIPGWREDNFNLRYALGIGPQAIWDAHTRSKQDLIQYVNRQTNVGLDSGVFTLGFGRRAASYKRADLLFTDVDRIRKIHAGAGPLQVVYAGKAHPHDQEGKELIKRIFGFAAALKPDVKVVYLPNYDMQLARLMTAGVDTWLNTPLPPMEASGTSGMKAALNGVPSLSVLDGWWLEGCIEGVTGWGVGEDRRATGADSDPTKDAASLYAKLETVVLPTFYHSRDRFLDIMRHTIALNGSFFNTQRMIQQYVLKAYFD